MANPVPLVAMTAFSAAMTAAAGLSAAKSKSSDIQAMARRKEAEILQKQKVEERQKREQLRIAVARQRARFGAAGINSRSGSAAARLSGLAAQTDRDLNDTQTTNRMSIDNIRADADKASRDVLKQGRSSAINTGLGAAYKIRRMV